MNAHQPKPWPKLVADEWTPTRDTLHRWTQIVGKTRMALSPMLNHWWNVPLYVTPRGLTTGSMPYRHGLCEIVFDLVNAKLMFFANEGVKREMELREESVADFYDRYRAVLRELEIEIKIWPVPVEVEDTTPFSQDWHHHSFDPDAARRFWEVLVVAHSTLEEFRSRFTGKCSPVHFFWGSFDLAVTRFSGRPAPEHPHTPGLADSVTREAYCEEVSSAGWWPGGGGMDAAFYSYAYPTPDGYDQTPIICGSFNSKMGEFILPYEEARQAEDPKTYVTDFLQSTYEAAANLAHWDRSSLERPML